MTDDDDPIVLFIASQPWIRRWSACPTRLARGHPEQDERVRYDQRTTTQPAARHSADVTATCLPRDPRARG